MNEEIRKSKHIQIPLKLFPPEWNSDLTSTIVELENLRSRLLMGGVPTYIFFQLKEIFHWLESLGSSRIEGNRTTLAELVEKVIEGEGNSTDKEDEQIQEIFNIGKAIGYVEENIKESSRIVHEHIFEIHKIIVNGLTPQPEGEGSKYPGRLRPTNASIRGIDMILPSKDAVSGYFDELLQFVNADRQKRDDLLATAVAHHRMLWIHPFDNGNGRVARMFTYAMLIKQGFQVQNGRILNPTTIFCADRDRYYRMLSKADTGREENVIEWCTYVLSGLKGEITKIDNLLDKKYTTENILLPALEFAFDRENITGREYDILGNLVRSNDMSLRARDLDEDISQVHKSRIIRDLRKKSILQPITEGGRIYTIGFVNNYLLRGVIKALEDSNFVPMSLNDRYPMI